MDSTENDLLLFCSVWQQPCMKEKCISYEVHTKQRFKNSKTGQYIPLDQISFYKGMTQEQLDVNIDRNLTIVRECRQIGKIIEIVNTTDHFIPDIQ
jgi:hypothetical protein